MELRDAIRSRHMRRSFSTEALEPALIDSLLDLARRAPSAGNTQAVGFVVLDRPDLVARYWDTTLPAEGGLGRRNRFRWPGLLDAPALILVTTDSQRYLSRYSEDDKAKTGRGQSLDRWPVPYWWVDAGAVIQNLLLLVSEANLGACLFGPFDHEAALVREFGLDQGRRIVATIAIGYPLHDDEPGRSANRPRPQLTDVVIRPPARDGSEQH